MDGTPTIDPSAAHEARLLSLSADLLGTVGFDGRITLANPAWGAPVEGTALVELVDPADRARAAAAIARLAAGPGSEELVCRIGERTISFSAQSSEACIYLAGRDVTEQRRLEERLERANAELQDFAYVASHDLAEPLRMITSYLELLKRRYDGQLDETADEFIGYAVGGADRMKALIEDLLAYSRVGSHDLQRGPIDLAELMGLVLEANQRAIEEAGADVRLSAPLEFVSADPTQLGQLLQRVLANALLFRSADRPPVVEISTERERGGVRISVADNGIGIAEAQRERVFKMFARLHGRDEYEGTGMGLAVCRRIADRHGGRIWVESEPDRGSTFHVWLPGGA
jgi:light-regulated signal transduction histidine kinase (bacteriophytochrome)